MTVDEYLAGLPRAESAELKRIRRLVKRWVPDAVESISYMMPAFKYKKKPLVYYAAFKKHLSLFPTPGPAEVLKAQLAQYQTSKGTIQFTVDKPLPEALLREIIFSRVAEINKL
jgi:uncharacterized protein YdhG (YjbR/CyaY superfamily)